ncbi:sugar phosphate isomerase/epimerase [Sphaerochaeta pleomorpha str. Grapes]|uniref:Sugar phosphate isomerase/epimerase n=1 Tax=Sphaerochaeta pleomorpha (strain ATCC BAA-1885 / DSM 22778 / Grapes) TaxID=158190 RepID=G8QSW3_SPHPG|nr:sugar phosphate isomerase/epimerase family protein [Sphaerochaeta pleomorpha]AEV30145.1 sugar phosphate isomerase/epimerase [Sphaerochaeta pleomorpha str. Grapes]
MRTLGIYYGFWTHDWDVDFLPFVSKVKELGFDQLEVNGGTLVSWKEADRLTLVEEARKEGILLSYGLGMTAEHDVSSPCEEIRQNGIRFMKDMIKMVGRMGGGMIGGSTYCSWPKQLPKGDSKKEYQDQSLKSMKELVKVAEDNEVILNLEVLNRFEQFLFNTCEEILPFVEEIGSPNCGILLDTFHMNIEEDSLPVAIQLAGSHLKALHIGETNRKPVGLGRQPWKEIRSALDAIGFDGPLVEEPFVLPGGQVGQDISVWRNLFDNPDLDKLAADSAAFARRTLIL